MKEVKKKYAILWIKFLACDTLKKRRKCILKKQNICSIIFVGHFRGIINWHMVHRRMVDYGR